MHACTHLHLCATYKCGIKKMVCGSWLVGSHCHHVGSRDQAENTLTHWVLLLPLNVILIMLYQRDIISAWNSMFSSLARVVFLGSCMFVFPPPTLLFGRSSLYFMGAELYFTFLRWQHLYKFFKILYSRISLFLLVNDTFISVSMDILPLNWNIPQG